MTESKLSELPPIPGKMARVFADYPAEASAMLRAIRELIYALAADDPSIGPITETLKWSEPAFLTEATGSGTTVRLAWKEKRPNRIGIYVHCQTNIIETLREMLPPETEFEGNRAMLVDFAKPLPIGAVRIALRMALTYHALKRD